MAKKINRFSGQVLAQKKILDELIESLAAAEDLNQELLNEIESKTRLVEQELRLLRKQAALEWAGNNNL